MNCSKLLAAMLCCTATLTTGALAQEGKKPEMPKMPTMPTMPKEMPKGTPPADMSAMDSAEMEAMMKAGMPGPMHEWMGKFVGSWDASCKMWMKPGAPMMESKGTMTTDMMFGKYAHSMYKGDMMGQPFEGAAVMGYNNVTEKFESSWIDSMSTGAMASTGTLSADKKTLTMTGETVCPMTKKPCATREVYKWINDNNYIMEMYSTKDGTEWKVMEISYTKSKGAMKEKDAMDKLKDEAAKKSKEMEDKLKAKMPTK